MVKARLNIEPIRDGNRNILDGTSPIAPMKGLDFRLVRDCFRYMIGLFLPEKEGEPITS